MRRRISALLLLVLVSFLLSACGYKTFDFSGESDNWTGELKVTQTEDEWEEQELKLQYKGNDVNSVGEIEYNVETNAGGFGGSGLTLEENGTFKASKEANPTNAKIIEEAEVVVTIEWNGHTETIILNIN
ncbi:hypothetical protein HMPREF1210_00990 [Paenisporosarcina sp. HGH0030]|uniref:hypothetical protein n=1 Tax=Paenisporosarcina sp. HGH0030 TaxID=1078085 RepID=UPI00034E1744|nr:hypothetical protein [Paenisporosarcina sp. HGH0030]EPD53259.1 hypothetical protein HMPREF1210_00990 [Paenisporosarcina sp. HGH0030]